MEQIAMYVGLLGIIVIVAIFFDKASTPNSLLLVITGMLLSLIPNFPHPSLQSDMVLYIFLPLLIYQASSFTSWREVKTDLRLISLLSIGHVVFITVLVAATVHYLIPELGWPLAFVLGAVISPPDDVAILTIAEKIKLPRRIVTVLKGEGLLNDATALILFRFALAAILTHEFSPFKALSDFILILIGETCYGLFLGFVLGELRLKLTNSTLQTLISLLTPFLAYLPPAMLGGSGVLATVVTGIFLGNVYLDRFPPEVRLNASSVWSTLGFTVQGILFLLIGLDLPNILHRISAIPTASLLIYSLSVIFVVIAGRFIWVYPCTYLPSLLFKSVRKKDPPPPWQFPFVVSWAGMRGGVSLAAALAVPSLPILGNNIHPQDLLVFLVFCVILATLILQGLALPWILKILGIFKFGENEQLDDELAELKARIEITTAVLRWLTGHKKHQRHSILLEEIDFRIHEYETQKKFLEQQLKHKNSSIKLTNIADLNKSLVMTKQLLDVERTELSRLWREKKIDLDLRNKLLRQLDHRSSVA